MISESSKIQYVNKSGRLIPDTNFAKRVIESSGTSINRCYQCQTCSLGCPVVFAMDYMPNQIVRMVQLGLKEQALKSSTIWVCASCETCATRCPNGIDIARLMDTLKEIALQEGVAENASAAFHRAFLGNINRRGRQHELSLALQLKLKARDFSDLGTGVKMLVKGKLRLLPPRLKDMKGVKAIFKKIDRTGGENS